MRSVRVTGGKGHRCAADRRRVAATAARLISTDEAARLSDLFRLLGDPTRARILFALRVAGELCVCDLAAAVGVAETSASHALRLLRAARVVRTRRAGRMIFYRLDDDHVRRLLDRSREHLRHGAGSSRRRRPGASARGRAGAPRPRGARG